MTDVQTRTVQELTFPPDFLWGAATAAFQIEGATAEDGRTPSIWDTFARVPGAVVNGDTGDVACDHYHRMPEDVALMRELNLDAYRFSVAWPRVRPDVGPVNQAGLDFYRRLVDELLAAGIRPWVTLYHWDLPQALEDAGGWTNRDTAYRFADYALSVHDAIGDRAPTWTTLNEPWCTAFLGYTGGQHAPGRQEGVAGLVAAHHLMLGHGLVVEELRRRSVTADLGHHLEPHRRATRTTPPTSWTAMPRAVSTRCTTGPSSTRSCAGPTRPTCSGDTADLSWQGRPWADVVRQGDLATISTPIDVLGVNYYKGDAVSGHPRTQVTGVAGDHPDRPTSTPFVGCEDITFPSRGLPVTDMGWEVQPEGLTRLLKRLHDDYDAPVMYITENGAAYADTVAADGTVDDPERLAYVDSHLRAVHAAIEQGVDVRGFFQWSLLDNYEWAYGYGKRFGIVHVDYDTQVRTPKSSALFYAEVARTGQLGRGGPTS